MEDSKRTSDYPTKRQRIRIRFPRLFQPDRPIPLQHQSNFRKLYADIGWYGLLNGSTLAFLSIYATRLGASADQIGLISAAPAIVALFLALPGGAWIEKRHLGKVVFQAAVFQRFFYLLIALLPLLANRPLQVWILILFVLLMSIPGTIIGMGFNALLADLVPIDWRGYVVGIRNAVFSVTTITSSLLSGYILGAIEFRFGYMIIFGMGFIGAAASAYLLYQLRLAVDAPPRPVVQIYDTPPPRSGLLLQAMHSMRKSLHLEVLRGPFGLVLALLVTFHFTHVLPVPMFPVFQVNVLGLSDTWLSIGSALFSSMVMIGSTQLARVSSRLGNGRTTGLGMLLQGMYPLLLSQAQGPGLYLVANVVSGAGWSLAGGALYNYLLERVPAESRAAGLAWFSLGINAAILAGSLLGPLIGSWMPITIALLVFALLRLLTGIALMRWG